MNIKSQLKILEKIKQKFSLSAFFTLTSFIFILVLSWFYLSQSHKQEEEQLHSLLQIKFQNLISDYVAKKHPEVDEIIFHKIWTKSTSDPNQIKFFFHYSLLSTGQSGGDLLIKGESLLEKSAGEKELWIAKDFKVMDSFLTFSEPLVIRAGSINNN